MSSGGPPTGRNNGKGNHNGQRPNTSQTTNPGNGNHGSGRSNPQPPRPPGSVPFVTESLQQVNLTSPAPQQSPEQPHFQAPPTRYQPPPTQYQPPPAPYQPPTATYQPPTYAEQGAPPRGQYYSSTSAPPTLSASVPTGQPVSASSNAQSKKRAADDGARVPPQPPRGPPAHRHEGAVTPYAPWPQVTSDQGTLMEWRLEGRPQWPDSTDENALADVGWGVRQGPQRTQNPAGAASSYTGSSQGGKDTGKRKVGAPPAGQVQLIPAEWRSSLKKGLGVWKKRYQECINDPTTYNLHWPLAYETFDQYMTRQRIISRVEDDADLAVEYTEWRNNPVNADLVPLDASYSQLRESQQRRDRGNHNESTRRSDNWLSGHPETQQNPNSFPWQPPDSARYPLPRIFDNERNEYRVIEPCPDPEPPIWNEWRHADHGRFPHKYRTMVYEGAQEMFPSYPCPLPFEPWEGFRYRIGRHKKWTLVEELRYRSLWHRRRQQDPLMDDYLSLKMKWKLADPLWNTWEGGPSGDSQSGVRWQPVSQLATSPSGVGSHGGTTMPPPIPAPPSQQLGGRDARPGQVTGGNIPPNSEQAKYLSRTKPRNGTTMQSAPSMSGSSVMTSSYVDSRSSGSQAGSLGLPSFESMIQGVPASQSRTQPQQQESPPWNGQHPAVRAHRQPMKASHPLLGNEPRYIHAPAPHALRQYLAPEGWYEPTIFEYWRSNPTNTSQPGIHRLNQRIGRYQHGLSIMEGWPIPLPYESEDQFDARQQGRFDYTREEIHRMMMWRALYEPDFASPEEIPIGFKALQQQARNELERSKHWPGPRDPPPGPTRGSGHGGRGGQGGGGGGITT